MDDRACGELLADSLQDGHGVGGDAVVIGPHHHGVIGIGTHHGHFPEVFGEGKGLVVIFKEDQALAGHFQGLGLMFCAFYHRHRDGSPGHLAVVVEHAQFHAGGKQPQYRLVDGCFVKKAFMEGLLQGGVMVAAFDVGACPYGSRGGRSLIGMGFMSSLHPEIGNGATVGDHHPLETPFVAQNSGQ